MWNAIAITHIYGGPIVKAEGRLELLSKGSLEYI
jgi:hypothetical protein